MADTEPPDPIGGYFQEALLKLLLLVPGVAVRILSVPGNEGAGILIDFHADKEDQPYEVRLANDQTQFFNLGDIELDAARERKKLDPIRYYPCTNPRCRKCQTKATILVHPETETLPDLTTEGYRQYRCQECERIIKVNQDGQLVS